MADARVPEGVVQGGFVVYTDAHAPVPGLVQGNFTVLLAKDGAVNGTAVIVSEVGNGRYHYEFDATGGEWFLVIRYSPENARGWSEDVLVASVSVGSGSGGAPRKYWDKPAEMRNAFMLDDEQRALQIRVAQKMKDSLDRVERAERLKLVAALLLMDNEGYL